MKKAKMLLAAIAVFAVVGGVYASKAKRNAVVYCSTTTTIQGSTLRNFTIAPLNVGTTSYCTATFTAPITKTTWISALN